MYTLSIRSGPKVDLLSMRSVKIQDPRQAHHDAVLIIGAGQMSAALARAVSAADLSVSVLDDPLHSLPGRAASDPAAPLPEIFPWLVAPGFAVECLVPCGKIHLDADAVVLPIQSRERLVPFPGCDLAEVSGIGMPLSQGAEILVVGPRPWRDDAMARVARAGAMARRAETRQFVTWVERDGGRLRVTLSDLDRNTVVIETDRLMVSDGWLPATDIFRLLRAEMRFDEAAGGWLPRMDAAGRCSVPFLYALVGAPEQLFATIMADRAAGQWPPLPPPERQPDSQTGLDPRVAQLADDAVICPCEGITAGEARSLMARGLREINQLKSATRCGMGECGGRLCEDIAARLLASGGRTRTEVGYWSGRAPLAPIPLSALTGEFGYSDIPIPAAAPL